MRKLIVILAFVASGALLWGGTSQPRPDSLSLYGVGLVLTLASVALALKHRWASRIWAVVLIGSLAFAAYRVAGNLGPDEGPMRPSQWIPFVLCSLLPSLGALVAWRSAMVSTQASHSHAPALTSRR